MIRYLFVYRVKFEILLQVVSTSFTVIIVSIVRLHMRISRDILLIFHRQLSLMIDELENPEIEMSLCGNTSLANLTLKIFWPVCWIFLHFHLLHCCFAH